MNDNKASVSSVRRNGEGSRRQFWISLEDLVVPEALPELLKLGKRIREFGDILAVSEHFEPLWCYFDMLEELERGP